MSETRPKQHPSIARPLATQAAARLRAHPALMEDLQWHTAAIAAFLTNIEVYEIASRNAQRKVRTQPE